MKRMYFKKKPVKPMKGGRLRRKSKSETSKLQTKCDTKFQEVGKKLYPFSEVSGKPTEVIHHFFTKQSSNALRYDLLENAIPLTNAEHFAHHKKSDPTIHATIIRKRGQQWYERLKLRKFRESVKTNKEYYEHVYTQLLEKL